MNKAHMRILERDYLRISGSYEDSVDEKEIKLEIESEEDKSLIKDLINEK